MPRQNLGVVRTEVNLFEEDKETMMKHYGTGWTAMIRELVQNHCVMIRTDVIESMKHLTEDFNDDQ